MVSRPPGQAAMIWPASQEEGVAMNCYMCARERLNSIAVVICPHCGAALCLLHVTEETAAPRPGGLYTACTHDTWTPPSSVRANARLAEHTEESW